MLCALPLEVGALPGLQIITRGCSKGDGLKMDKRREAMSDEKSEKARDSKQTLRDDQIVTEPTFGRRSFLTAVGSIVVGGAAAVVLGDTLEAAAQQGDPDAKKAADPNAKDEIGRAHV